MAARFAGEAELIRRAVRGAGGLVAFDCGHAGGGTRAGGRRRRGGLVLERRGGGEEAGLSWAKRFWEW